MKKPIPIQAKVVQKKQLTADVFEIHVESTPPFSFQAGQFISVVIPGAGPGGRDLRRAYSIASNPENPVAELCIKLVEGGPGTNYLNNLKIGESFKGNAPFGDFIYKPRTGRATMMIATGTGIAPFRAMILSDLFKQNPPTKTHLLFGARDEADLLYTEECRKILGDGFVQALSRPHAGWKGITGRVTHYLLANKDKIDWMNTDYYLCGNGAMIDEVKQILATHGVEKTSIHQEVYYKPKAGAAGAHASQDD